jgi:ergothioneine biosynthesis protein EgtB
MPIQTTDLINHFLQVRATSESLVAPLSPEDCQAQSMPDASPAKWHLAHVNWFFETFVLQHYEKDFKPWNPAYQALFNSYYNALGDKHPRPDRGLLTRPSLDEVMAWRRVVNERIQNVLTTCASTELLWIFRLGIEHEKQHQELLLTDIKHLFSCSGLYPTYKKSAIQALENERSLPKMCWLPGHSGIQEMGVKPQNIEFHFDNEAPRHSVYLNPYEMGHRLISNSEWQAFITDGGYDDYRWWLDAGWSWLKKEGVHAPLYWHTLHDQASIFTLHGNQALDLEAPVSHISYFEADAFARWKSATDANFKGARLPSEAEWECFVDQNVSVIPADSNIMESNLLTPLQTQVTQKPTQFFGDVWEWTSSHYMSYPGYQPWGGIAGEYNGKFMVNQMVLKGGSCLTPRSHVRSTYRNFFPTSARWQMTGLRLARDFT